jgi:hypothetical protein
MSAAAPALSARTVRRLRPKRCSRCNGLSRTAAPPLAMKRRTLWGARSHSVTPRAQARRRDGARDDDNDNADEEGTTRWLGSAESDIAPWQDEELCRQLAKGRRRFSVLEACKQSSLPRQDVLLWLRRNAHRALSESEGDSEPAKASRHERSPGAPSSASSEAVPPLDRVDGRRLTSPQLKTLEKLWQQSSHPSWQRLESAWQLTGVPKRVSLRWFRIMRQRQLQLKHKNRQSVGDAVSVLSNDLNAASDHQGKKQHTRFARKRSNKKRGGSRRRNSSK